jgi:hypothetical protein
MSFQRDFATFPENGGLDGSGYMGNTVSVHNIIKRLVSCHMARGHLNPPSREEGRFTGVIIRVLLAH